MSGINLVEDTISQIELEKLASWILTNPRLTKGEKTLDFETAWSLWNGCKHSLFVNSGSSANLIMASALKYCHNLRNNKIIAPAVSWGTTISPFMQMGFDVELCDSDKDTFGLDIEHLQKLVKEHKPAALILVHVLGCPNKMDEIIDICKNNDIVLLEDCCESHGSEYKGKKVGTFGEMSSFSFYYGHHMSTIEGGMVCYNSDKFYELSLMLRSHGWIRDLSTDRQKELARKYNMDDFNSLYFFLVPGFNLRSTDLNAFLGITQLKSLDQKIEKRNKIWWEYKNRLGNKVKTQNPKDSKISPLAFGLISDNRDSIAKDLMKNNIECRPLICGNIETHPFWKKEPVCKNATIIHTKGMYIPVHEKLKDSDITKICNIILKNVGN